MKYLENFNRYDNYRQIFEVEGLDLPIDLFKQPPSEEEYEKILGRKGELSDYLRENGKKFTFGILRNIFNDAIAYKKKRELVKGSYKMIHRAIPMILAYVYFPLWLVGNILGFSRALNKVLKPLLKNPESNYNKFLIKFIKATIAITEGEIKYVIGNDWFYNAFVMDDDLLKMLKKEVVRDFAVYLANEMEKEDDDTEVPHHYVENSLKQYLNDNFNINPPMNFKN